MPKALYRRYRPQKLADVIGEPEVTEVLEKSVSSGKFSHAYLFIGPRGTGKTSTARIFAHLVNGFPYQVEDSYPDIIEIDAASNTGVDDIRELRDSAIIAPTEGKYKVYIIDEVHMLSKSAFNALLKILEEPPESVIFIMATTDAYKVPVTITSRAQTFTFHLASEATILPYLQKISEKEGINISESALKIIARRGGGSFRDTLSLLDQISILSTKDHQITEKDIETAFGLPSSEIISQILADFAAKNTENMTKHLENLFSSGIKPETISEELLQNIIKDPRPEFLSLLGSLPEIRAPFAEARLLSALLLPIAGEKSTSVGLPASSTHVASLTSGDTSVVPIAPETIAPETTTPEKTSSAPATPAKTSSAPPESSSDFSWQTYLDAVYAKNDGIAGQLEKTEHEFSASENTLHLYPKRKIVGTILGRENNFKILTSVATEVAPGNFRVKLHEFGEQPENIQNDPLLSEISAIMGSVEEVKNDGGDPFES